MPEVIHSRELERPVKPKRSFGIVDVLGFSVILVIIVVLAFTLTSKLKLKHEVSTAKVTANTVISDIANQDAKGLLAQGNKKFQSTYSETELAGKIKPIASIYSSESPSVLSQTVTNSKAGKQVTFVYQYNRLKLPFYIRVTVYQLVNTTKWNLTGLSGSSDLKQL